MKRQAGNPRPSAGDIRSRVTDWKPVFEAFAPSLNLRGEGMQRYGRCPFHDDRQPSFSLNTQTGQWICFAGCGQGDAFSFVMKVLGVDFPEALERISELVGMGAQPRRVQPVLTLRYFADAKGLPVQLLVDNGWEESRGGLRVTYRDLKGKPAPRVRRHYALAAKAGSSWDGPKEAPLIPYGLWRLDEARRAKQLILVEGETDTLTLWHHGFPALGLPGSGTASLLEPDYLEEIDTLYVVREPDAGGTRFAEGVAARVRRFGWAGALKEIPFAEGDVNDLHRSDPRGFRSAFLGLMSQAQEPEPATGSFAGLSPAAPFPALALPEPLCDFVEAASKAVICPADFIGVPLLVACAAAVGNTCRLEVKRGWHEEARFFAAIVAEPGSRKSPALDTATKFILRRQVRLREAYQQDLARYHDELELYEEARREKSKDAPPRPPERPVLSQVYVSDTTIEALAEILRDNPRGVLLVRDELAGWLRDQGRYQNGRSGDRKHWLSLWSGAPLVVNRKSLPEPIVIPDPFVNVVGALIPDGLSEVLGDLGYSDGFVERILFAFPDPVPVRWSEAEVADELERAVDSLFDSLWTLSPDTAEGTPTPRTFRLSTHAKTLFRTLLNEHYEEMNGPHLSDALRGAWSKLEAYFARLTLIIHVCRYVQGMATQEIDEESVLRASVLLDYFKSHTRRVFEYIYGSEQDKRIDKALRWLRRQEGTEIPVRDFLTAKVGGVVSMEDVQSLLSELEQRGVGFTATQKTGERGPGRHVFRVLAAAKAARPP